METKIEFRWTKEEDRNTKSFHSMANHHRMTNYVEEMEIDDQIVKGNEQFRQGVMEFFGRLCCEELNWRPKLDGPPTIRRPGFNWVPNFNYCSSFPLATKHRLNFVCLVVQ